MQLIEIKHNNQTIFLNKNKISEVFISTRKTGYAFVIQMDNGNRYCPDGAFESEEKVRAYLKNVLGVSA